MKTPDLHPTQLGILNKLLFAQTLRYSDLKIDPEMENNTFQFHLDKVLSMGFVEKVDEGYSLTLQGKKMATHIKTESNEMVRIRKVSASLYCIRNNKGIFETLIYRRLKHPFYGKQGFPTGKIDLGERFEVAAQRELLEETGFQGNPVLFNIIHYLVKDSVTHELLDDKLLFEFFVKEPTGVLTGSSEGEYEWIPINQIREKIQNPFDSIDIYQKALEHIMDFDGVVFFEELEHLTDDF
ncbi:NUDIX hydrolase [candidate division WWE3 bacterium]|uniref:NUDIX hydrolase n=1 Tax=candidate division WWE3 bacterium TaxID=2053526 RepID=A0A955LVZ2_UNCKA|nr:NUDIX hydrolase [candidate division WWE3 bacterium]